MSSTLWKGFLAIAILGSSFAFAPSALASLRRGDTGRSVEDLQIQLGVPADGVFGAQTEEALLDYQSRRGLEVDGIAGPATLEALGLDPDSQGDVPFRSSSADGPYRVVIPGDDTEMLSRARRVVPSAEFANDGDRGDFIDAGGYESRSSATEVVEDLQDLNLEARVDFKRD